MLIAAAGERAGGRYVEFFTAQIGVAARFAENGTLSSLGHEPGANITQRPESGAGIAVGPHIVAGERDVLPPEGCDVRE